MRQFDTHAKSVDDQLLAASDEVLSLPSTLQTSVAEGLGGAEPNLFALSNALSTPLYSEAAFNAALSVSRPGDVDDDDDADDMPAAASSQNAIHISASVGPILTAKLGLGGGGNGPSNGETNAGSDAAGIGAPGLAVEVGVLDAADMELFVGSNDDDDQAGVDAEVGEEASATNAGAATVSLTTELGTVDAELAAAASEMPEAGPSDGDDEPDDTGPDDTGTGDNDGSDGGDGLLSGASSDLLDAMSDIAALECGCDEDDSDTDANDDAGDGSAGGDDTSDDSTDGDDADQDAGPDGADGSLLSDALDDSGIDLHADADAGMNDASASVSAASSSDDDAADSGDGMEDDGTTPDTEPAPDDSSAPSQGSIGAELHAALAVSMANAQLDADAGTGLGEDLSQIGAAMGSDAAGSDQEDGSDPDASSSGLDLGLEPSSNDDCGCQSPFQSVEHVI